MTYVFQHKYKNVLKTKEAHHQMFSIYLISFISASKLIIQKILQILLYLIPYMTNYFEVIALCMPLSSLNSLKKKSKNGTGNIYMDLYYGPLHFIDIYFSHIEHIWRIGKDTDRV